MYHAADLAIIWMIRITAMTMITVRINISIWKGNTRHGLGKLNLFLSHFGIPLLRKKCLHCAEINFLFLFLFAKGKGIQSPNETDGKRRHYLLGTFIEQQ